MQALHVLELCFDGRLDLLDFRNRILEAYNLAAHKSYSSDPHTVSKYLIFVYLIILIIMRRRQILGRQQMEDHEENITSNYDTNRLINRCCQIENVFQIFNTNWTWVWTYLCLGLIICTCPIKSYREKMVVVQHLVGWLNSNPVGHLKRYQWIVQTRCIFVHLFMVDLQPREHVNKILC